VSAFVVKGQMAMARPSIDFGQFTAIGPAFIMGISCSPILRRVVWSVVIVQNRIGKPAQRADSQ
jgi:hypothetical protein